MFRHKNCTGCGSSKCETNMLMRLSTVAEPISVIEAEYGLDPRTIAELTGLEKDVVGPNMVYRGGYPFFPANSPYSNISEVE